MKKLTAIKFEVCAVLMLFSLGVFAKGNIKNHKSLTSIADKIDTYLVSATKAYKFNGSALVAKDGEIIFHNAYGWKNVNGKTTNDTKTRFPILSITKSFTAVVLLKLQEQGKLSLKDKQGKYSDDLTDVHSI